MVIFRALGNKPVQASEPCSDMGYFPSGQVHFEETEIKSVHAARQIKGT